MPVYKKLLLSAGGGIIDAGQLMGQADNTAHIFIGLGGADVDCIRRIKTQVHQRIVPDDCGAAIQTY